MSASLPRTSSPRLQVTTLLQNELTPLRASHNITRPEQVAVDAAARLNRPTCARSTAQRRRRGGLGAAAAARARLRQPIDGVEEQKRLRALDTGAEVSEGVKEAIRRSAARSGLVAPDDVDAPFVDLNKERNE